MPPTGWWRCRQAPSGTQRCGLSLTRSTTMPTSSIGGCFLIWTTWWSAVGSRCQTSDVTLRGRSRSNHPMADALTWTMTPTSQRDWDVTVVEPEGVGGRSAPDAALADLAEPDLIAACVAG